MRLPEQKQAKNVAEIVSFFFTFLSNNLPSHVKKKFYTCFLHNNFQNPIVIKWISSIDYPLECFVRIIAVMVDVFRPSPERKLVNALFANEEHLNYRVIHVAVI